MYADDRKYQESSFFALTLSLACSNEWSLVIEIYGFPVPRVPGVLGLSLSLLKLKSCRGVLGVGLVRQRSAE